MASLQLFALALCSIIIAVQGQTVNPEDLAGLVNVTNTAYAWTFSDGYAVIHGGDISAKSLNLTGEISGAEAFLGDLHAGNTTAEQLTAMDTHVHSLSVYENQVATEDSWIGGDATVHGSLSAAEASLNQTDASTLTVVGDAVIGGIVFAQTNVQVTQDLNVGGNTRIFGDLLANSSLTVEDSLTVNDEAQIYQLTVENTLSTHDLMSDVARFGDTMVDENSNVTGDLSVTEDLVVKSNSDFDGDLTAVDAEIMYNLWVGDDLTIDGWLYVDRRAGFSMDLMVGGSLVVDEWLEAESTVSVGGDLSAGENLMVSGDITSEMALLGVDAMFTTLSVDTGSIETLTAGFITSTTLVATDATIGNSFVSGMTTLDTLHVLGDSHLTDVMATVVTAQMVVADNTTTGSLTVTGLSEIDSAEVKLTISVGKPNQTDYYGAFDSGFADYLKIGNLMAQEGQINNLRGMNLNYEVINADQVTLENLTSTTGKVERSDISDAWIDSLVSDHAEIEKVYSQTLQTNTLMSEDGTITFLSADSIHTINITSYIAASFDLLTSEWLWTRELTANSGTFETLESEKGWIDDLTSTNGMLSYLWSTTATVTLLEGNGLWYEKGHVTDLWSHQGITETLDATQFIQTSWLWSEFTNFTTLEAETLYATDMAWFDEAWVRGDLNVDGKGTLQNGMIAGHSVVAGLDVVGSTSMDGLSVNDAAFMTDLYVKRVTITDEFEANTAKLGDTTLDSLTVVGDASVSGSFNVDSDSFLGGNLVVSGTTQFQTGSFSRIGSAIITTTDMEAFNMDVANGLFGSITVDDLTVNRVATFHRSITLAPQRNSVSGGTYSWNSAIAPTTLHSDLDGGFNVNSHTVLHSGFNTVDALVVSSSSDPTVAALRIHGDGTLDFIDGDVLFDTLEVAGGIVFENENNLAWLSKSAVSNMSLALGESDFFYTYSDLIDRDFVAPGDAYDPTRFQSPNEPTDLLTLAPGHYKVSGTVYFELETPAVANAVSVAVASIHAWWGTESNSSVIPFWATECVANFNVVSGSVWGGSCAFSDVIGVPKGEMVTLRTQASWVFSTSGVGSNLIVGPGTQLLLSELFERTSQEL